MGGCVVGTKEGNQLKKGQPNAPTKNKDDAKIQNDPEKKEIAKE